MGFIGKGRIVSERRVEPCGAPATWHVVLFMDDSAGRERAVGASIDMGYALAIKARWEKETLAVFDPAPVKYSETGQRTRKKPTGRDPRASNSMGGRMRQKQDNPSKNFITTSN